MKPFTRPPLAQSAALLVLIALGALKLALPLYATPLQWAHAPNEGWFALSVAAWRDGLPLYPGTDEFFVVNYLPLAYAPYRALEFVFGDLIFAGRCLSWLLFAAIVAASALAAFFATRQRWPAAIAGALVFATFAVWFNDKLGAVEPQLIGHVLQLIALVLLLRSPRNRTQLVIATLLMIAGGLVKPNLFGLPGGLALFMCLMRREDLWFLARFFIPIGILIPLLLYLMFGSNLLLANVLLGRVYASSALLNNLKVLSAIAVPLIACLIGLPRRPSTDASTLMLCVLGGSALELLSTGAALGVTGNAGYDLALTACIGAGVACGRLGDVRIARVRAVDAILVPAGLRVVFAVLPQLHALPADFAEMQNEDREAKAIIAQLAAVSGQAACSHPSFCYWAGKRMRVDLSGSSDGFFRPARSHDLLRPLLAGGPLNALELYRGLTRMPDFAPALDREFRRVDVPVLRAHDATPRFDDSLIFVRMGAAR